MRILPFHRIYEVYDDHSNVVGKLERQEDEWIFLPYEGFIATEAELDAIQSKISELNERDRFYNC